MTDAAACATLRPARRAEAERIGDSGRLPEESVLAHPGDVALRDGLRGLAASDPHFWDFGRSACRDFAHGYFQYPAMMVPAMVRDTLDQLAAHRRGRLHLFDPFAGSGTVVTEAIRRGWDVTAVDLNPLAVLLCRTKAGPFFPNAVRSAVAEVVSHARQGAAAASCWFPNVRKWFEPDVIAGLTRLRGAIDGVGLPAARRFLRVAMAETVRVSSNSRMSTAKLHAKAAQDRVAVDAVEIFARIAARNLGLLEAETAALRTAGRLRRGHPSSRTEIVCGDAAHVDLGAGRERPNVLVTSPPYGDNHSTIPYGQHAYLPLRWIGSPEADTADRSALAGPATIDSMSLGGRRRNGVERAESLAARSEAARSALGRLSEIRQDHADKVGAFLSDLDAAFSNALRALAPGSHVVATVGDRTVSGMRIPTARVVQDIVTASGGVTVAAIPRRLPPARRAASRNCFAPRMRSEWMLVMRLP